MIVSENLSAKTGSIVSNGWLWSIMDQGVISIATFLSTVLIVRSVSKEEYGSYTLVLSLMVFLLGFQRAIVGFPYTVLSQQVIQNKKKVLLGSATLLSILSYLLFICLFIPLAKIKSTQTNNTIIDLLPYFIVTCGPYVFRDFFRTTMLAELKSFQSCWSNFIASAVHVIILTWFWRASTLNLQTALLVLAFSSAIGALILFVGQVQQIRIQFAAILPDFSNFFSSGKWYVVNVFLYNFTSQAPLWLIVSFYTRKEVAVFAACLSMASMLAPLQRGINAFLLPKLTKAYKESGSSGLHKQLRMGILMTLIPNLLWLAITVIAGESIMSLVFGHSYSLHGDVLILLTFKACLEAISGPLTTALQAIDAAKSTTMAIAFNACLTLLIGWPGIAFWGAAGAALVAILTSGSAIILKSYTLYRRIEKVVPAATDNQVS